jgi:hypothetical protein
MCKVLSSYKNESNMVPVHQVQCPDLINRHGKNLNTQYKVLRGIGEAEVRF